MNKEALYYEVRNERVYCYLCPHNCGNLQEGDKGLCKVREVKKDKNQQLKLYSINYGEITSISVDRIEKKPFYEFYPGSEILSIGSFGCNFKCSFCQNYAISQFSAKSKYVSPSDMARISLATPNNIGLAFTYNEPCIWYEYVLDTVKEIKNKNKEHKVVLVTNGYINEEPLRELLVYVDALNIDLKGNDEYYKLLCAGRLKEVMRTISIANEMKKHIEITTLLIPGENTDDETLFSISKFIRGVNPDIPLHLTRYFPRYKLQVQSTPLDEMKKAFNIVRKDLKHIYLGNLTRSEYEYCIASN